MEKQPYIRELNTLFNYYYHAWSHFKEASPIYKTAIVYGILILLLFILKLYTEIPPFGGGGGGGGNLGYVELASGNIQPMSEETTTTPNPVEETAKPTPATPEEIMTQENEESAKIEEIPKPKKETEKPVVKKII